MLTCTRKELKNIRGNIRKSFIPVVKSSIKDYIQPKEASYEQYKKEMIKELKSWRKEQP